MGRAWPFGGLAAGIALAGCLAAIIVAMRGHRASAMAVTGHVLDERGRPVSGAELFIQTSGIADVGVTLRREVSDAEGAFRFTARDGVPLEIYSRTAGRAGLFSLSTHGVRDAASFATSPVVLRIKPFAPVRVHVLDARGKPVAGIRVGPALMATFPGEDFDPAPVTFRELAAVTDAAGRATIGSIPSKGIAMIDTDDGRFAVFGKLIEPKGETRVVVQPACRVEGKVTIDGSPVVGLRLRWSVGRAWGNVLTDFDGRFVVTRAPKGLLTIEDATTGDRQRDFLLPDEEVRADPSARKRLDIQLQKGTLLSIRVVDDAGRSVSGAHVNGEFSDKRRIEGNVVTLRAIGEWGEIVTDAQGSAQVRVRPDRYAARFALPGERFTELQEVVVGDSARQEVTLRFRMGWSKDALRVQTIDAEGYPCRAKVWSIGHWPGTRLEQTNSWFAGSDGWLSLNDGPSLEKPDRIRAEFEDEVSDEVRAPDRGSIILRLHRQHRTGS